MSYSAESILPALPEFKVNDVDIEIKLVSLRTLSWLTAHVKDVKDIFNEVKEDIHLLADVCWVLNNNKVEFKYSKLEFKKFLFGKGSESMGEWVPRFLDAMSESFILSNPEGNSQAKIKELNEITNPESDGEPCYATYYDTLAKRYGYTLDNFYDLTLRQINILLRTADEEAYKDLEIKAALAGRKLQPKMSMLDVSEEQEAENQKDAYEALERLKKQYQERQDGK